MIWALILAAVALVAGGGGVAYASTDALPDDTLYPVKLLVEDAQLLFADPAEDLQLHLEFAQRRLDEALRLAQQGQAEGLDRAMANYEAHVQQALQLAQEMGQADPQVWALVEAQVAQHQERLQALREEMAQRGLAEAQQHMEEAQARAQEAHEQARQAMEAMGQRPEGMPTPPFGPMESPMPGGEGHGEGQGEMNGQGGMFGGQGEMNGNGGMGEMEGNGQGHGEGQGGMMTPPAPGGQGHDEGQGTMTPPSPMPGGEGDHDQGNMTPPYPMPTATMPMPGSGSGHDGGEGGGMPGGSGGGSGMGGWGNSGGMP